MWLCHVNALTTIVACQGTEAIRSLNLDVSKVEELFLDPNVLAKMHKLNFLKSCSNYRPTNYRPIVHLP